MKFNSEKWLEQTRKIITSCLSYGRCFVTLDKNNNPTIYDALDAVNWKQGEYVIFMETKEGHEENFEYVDPIEYVRVSFLDGVTYYERFTSEAKLIERKTTTKFEALPVICFGSTNLDWDVDILPLEGIATCALHIYKKTADLSYSEFSSCVPTMIATGVDDEATNKVVGGGVMLTIASELAKVYYATTDSNALQHVKIHIDSLFEEAKTYGASLLGGDKQEVESAEAIRLRQGAAGASLSSLTRNVELGINKLLVFAGFDNKFRVNFDLEENYLTPAEQSVLLDSWMQNGISYQTYFNNLQKAGIIEDERDFDTEVKAIKEEKEEKARDALKFQTAQNKLTETSSVRRVGDGNISNYDVSKSSTNDKVKVQDKTGSAGRSKNLNREGSDYETK